ncbi:arginine--tRNA ligase [Luteibaculum oceani]|uniref:Arginine--tRNA ligase n=1 Tax=Luteibaculum oceani TaxID=1294296 RepID=A0A5C6V976_9FLAO|nr:arginine--tRNA ligase [Luteibaculum oceani]TXC81992.1 arginine--tRNA ligase [Luteibaculum oceani]
MQQLSQLLEKEVLKAISDIFQVEENVKLSFQETRKEFDGEITLVTFPLTKPLKGKPEDIGEKIGTYLKENNALVQDFNVVKGFLNLVINDEYWLESLNDSISDNKFGNVKSENPKSVMVEFSSPNTNKPLHLGHLRNIFLGHAVSNILKANGHEVKKVQIINDRGIHICKSMLAWQLFGEGEAPGELKGDKLVGKYYVLFDKKYREQNEKLIAEWENKYPDDLPQSDKEKQLLFKLKTDGKESINEKDKELLKTLCDRNNKYLLGAQELLRKWESEDPKVRALWAKMNGWVYDGFEDTYKTMGVSFDKLYYESDTYLKGREVVLKGLKEGLFYQKEDGSIWIDLEGEGLDQKLLLRSDGTAVYMTQDIGTAIQRYEDVPELNQIVYTVGNEQDYHFQVLFKILEKMGYGWAKNCYHLSYGMVDLPSGKMKSREGTVVDADDLMKEMVDEAERIAQELGKVDAADKEAYQKLHNTVGLGALKYFLLKVDPKKRMLFDPKESIDFNGHTGPFIQYTYARIKSLLDKSELDFKEINTDIQLHATEKQCVVMLLKYPSIVKEAGENYNPALIANYIYDLVKSYNSFYQSQSILKEENKILSSFRLALSKKVSEVIAQAMNLLGIEVPERM